MAEMFGRIEFQFALPKLIHLAHLMHEYSQSQNYTLARAHTFGYIHCSYTYVVDKIW